MKLQLETQDPEGGINSPQTKARNQRRAKWESLSMSAAALLVVGAGILGLWLTSTLSIRQNYRHHLLDLAQAAAALIDPDLHNSIRRAEQRNGPDYQRAVEPLRRLRGAIAEVHYIYTVIRDGNNIRFVLDAADPGARRGTIEDQAKVGEIYDQTDPAMLRALGSGDRPAAAALTDKPYGDKWGLFMTAWAPLRDRSGRTIGAVGVDVDASVYMARLNSARTAALIGLAPAGLLIVVIGLLFYRIRLKGLNAAQQAMESAATLANERQHVSAVIDSVQIGTWERDLWTGIATVNSGVAAMLGYPLNELSPLPADKWQSFAHPDDRGLLQVHFDATGAVADSVFVREFRLKHADGHWVWVLARGRVLEYGDQGIPAKVAGILMDVSARKTAELALQESEVKFRTLFELLPIGIALTDATTGKYLQVNQAFINPTGYTRDELLQMSFWDITPARHVVKNQAQLDSLERTDRYGPYEKEYRRKDGSCFPVLLSGVRVQDSPFRNLSWSIVQDISQRKAAELELAAAARRDKLTGLANRARFMEHLQDAVARVQTREQQFCAVLFLDCDRFKLVNDTLGHDAGDELLRQIAERLRRGLRAADMTGASLKSNVVARFGGDEFLILLNDLKDGNGAGVVAERLLNILTPVYRIGSSEVHSTASIGIVISEQSVASAEDIVRNADVAMYEAKRAGRGCAVVFNEAMHARLARHVTIESNLRRAIGTSELSLVYQPIVELESGTMVSAEALLRWNHPTLGAISPGEFIPIAEETGLIIALDEWVLREACQALVLLRRQNPRRAPKTISVNLSRAELASGSGLIEKLRGILDQVGLPPHSLQLEVTEREVMLNPEASLKIMHQLRSLGVKLAMDDFGTGTSSLGCLRDYPFDTIKIDQSFAKDLTVSPDVLAVNHATINLIENLGMASLAEGVEEPAQVAVLLSLGCRYAQGYLFSKGVPLERLLDAVSKRADAPALMGS